MTTCLVLCRGPSGQTRFSLVLSRLPSRATTPEKQEKDAAARAPLEKRKEHTHSYEAMKMIPCMRAAMEAPTQPDLFRQHRSEENRAVCSRGGAGCAAPYPPRDLLFITLFRKGGAPRRAAQLVRRVLAHRVNSLEEESVLQPSWCCDTLRGSKGGWNL